MQFGEPNVVFGIILMIRLPVWAWFKRGDTKTGMSTYRIPGHRIWGSAVGMEWWRAESTSSQSSRPDGRGQLYLCLVIINLQWFLGMGLWTATCIHCKMDRPEPCSGSLETRKRLLESEVGSFTPIQTCLPRSSRCQKRLSWSRANNVTLIKASDGLYSVQEDINILVLVIINGDTYFLRDCIIIISLR